jgi:hypothetical protein
MKWTRVAFFLMASLAVAGVNAQGSQNTSRADGLADACKAYLNATYGSVVYPTHASNEIEIGLSSGYCSGYINGLISGSSLVAPRGGKPFFCVPKGVSVEEYAKLFIKNVDEHPELGHQSPLVVFLAILSTTWPCPAT